MVPCSARLRPAWIGVVSSSWWLLRTTPITGIRTASSMFGMLSPSRTMLEDRWLTPRLSCASPVLHPCSGGPWHRVPRAGRRGDMRLVTDPALDGVTGQFFDGELD